MGSLNRKFKKSFKIFFFVRCVIPVIFESLSALCFVLFALSSSKLLQELRQEGACCLGLLCASLSYEAEKIFKWIFSKFSSSAKDEVKLLYLCATYKALETVGEKKAFSSVMQVRMGGRDRRRAGKENGP